MPASIDPATGNNPRPRRPFLIAASTNEALERPTVAVIEPVHAFDGDASSNEAGRRPAPDAEV